MRRTNNVPGHPHVGAGGRAMKHCETCTCVKSWGCDELLKLLTNGQPHREVYRGDRTQRWFVTYGGGEADPEAVFYLVRMGKIHPVYNNTDDAFHVGPTLDLEKTMSERKRTGNKKLEIYVNEIPTRG